MNPLTNMKNITKLSQQDLHSNSKSSWHDQYKDSAWIYIGGLPFDLTEGDIICIFSQYGEVVNINLIRAKDTGKSKGFCFLCYEDQCSTILAVDNFNGIKILNRIIRVDHVQDYKVPKENKKTTEETKKLYAEGCAPKAVPVLKKEPEHNLRETLADQIDGNIKLPARLPIYTNIKQEKPDDTEQKIKERKKSKRSQSSNELSTSETGTDDIHIRKRSTSEERGRHDNKSSITSGSSKYDSSKRSKKYLDHSGKSHQSNHSRDRSRSEERDPKQRSNKRDVSPTIPKRWR